MPSAPECLERWDVAVVGAGASGYFAAIHAAEAGARVLLLEKSPKVLAKVRVSGGGRCNVTHACFDPAELCGYYPRGQKELRGPFHAFQPADTIAWFEQRGVILKTEADGRMFPITDSSETIAQCLEQAAHEAGVVLRTRWDVQEITPDEDRGFFLNGPQGRLWSARLILATGGSPKPEGLAWLQNLGLRVVSPVPSLFTFNLPSEKPLVKLAGIAVPAEVSLPEHDLAESGPVLITHWGLSGPAVLRLSAWGARSLAQAGYRFPIQVNWLGTEAHTLPDWLAYTRQQHGTRHIGNQPPAGLPRRLWDYLLERAGLETSLTWARLTGPQRDRLEQVLTADAYTVQGKTTFKDEFVTCGGVSLADIQFKTLQTRPYPRLYITGELLDIDAITGGFNFQAAWTTGFLAGTHAGRER